MRAFVHAWRESRDHAFELFDVVLDVVSRVPMLKEKRLYPPSSSSEEEEEEENDDDDENNDCNENMMNIEKEKRGYRRRVAGSNSVHKETVAKQMEQLGVILEKLDRERDRMKQFVDEMEKVVSRGNREQTQSRKTGGGFDEKSQASSLFESMERIEASWRFYGEETSACEALFGLCREAAEEAVEEKKKKKNDGGEESDGGEMVRSARAFLEVRRKVDLERRWIV
ncbi:unnamed protein product [Bathycoccus prasinos]